MATSTRTQPVVQGGLFSTPKASFSKETQVLLKVMMQESKLTNFQQRRLSEKMTNGESLPLHCLPTSSRPGNGRRTVGQSCKKRKGPQSHRHGLRSKEIIQQLNKETPQYRPSPQKYNVSKEKQRLQNLMAYGSDLEPARQLPGVQPNKEEEEEEEKDRFDEVVEEIEERRQFLAEMEALGQGKEYQQQIMTEISQKVLELEMMDKERTKQIEQ